MAGRYSTQSIKCLTALALVLVIAPGFQAQKKREGEKPSVPPATTASEIDKLRQQYIDATKEYKASLERLLALYQKIEDKANERLAKSKQLLAEGLISKNDVALNEGAVTAAHVKVAEAQSQMANADTQIAQTLVEVE